MRVIRILTIVSIVSAGPLLVGQGAPSFAAEARPTPPPVGSPTAPDDQPPGDDLSIIYVPYKDLSRVLAGKDRKVLVPYDEFVRLRDQVRRLRVRPGSEPPVPAVLTRADYRGRVQGELCLFDATLEVHVLRPGWVRVPIRLGEVAIRRATVGDKPAVLDVRQEGYEWLVSREGRHELQLQFVCPVAREGGHRGIGFAIPPAPIAQLELTVPEPVSGVQVVPVATASTQPTDTGQSRIVALLTQADRLRVTWRPRVRAPEDLPPLLTARTYLSARIDQGMLRMQSQFQVSALRGEVRHLEVQLPPGTTLLQKQPAEAGTFRTLEGNRVRLDLAQPLQSNLTLTLVTEQPLPAAKGVPLSLIAPQVVGAERQAGFLAVHTTDRFAVGVGRCQEARQIDVSRLPREMPGSLPTLAFTYAHPGKLLDLWVERVNPVLTARTDTRILLEEKATTVTTDVEWNIRNAGVGSVQVRLDRRLELVDVELKDGVESWETAQINPGLKLLKFELTDDHPRRVAVVVRAKLAAGRPPNPFRLPLPVLPGVSSQTGTLLVASAESLDVTPLSVPAGVQLLGRLERSKLPGAAEIAQAFEICSGYRYAAQRGRGAIQVRVLPKQAEVTARWAGTLSMEPDLYKWEQRLTYSIRYRGVPQLALLAPANLAKQLTIHWGSKRLPVEPEPVSPNAGGRAQPALVRIPVEFPEPVKGDVELVIGYAMPLPAGEPGQDAVNLAVWPVIPEGVTELTGEARITWHRKLDVRPFGANLQPLEAPAPGPDGAPPQRQWLMALPRPREPLRLAVSRYAAGGFTAVAIDRALVETLVSDNGQIDCRVRCLVRSARTEELVVQMPSGSRFVGRPMVAGARVDLKQSPELNRWYRLDISRAAARGEPFLVEWVYRIDEAAPLGSMGGLSLDPPRFGPRTVVRRQYWRLYLPDTQVVIGGGDGFVDENRWARQGQSIMRVPQLGAAEGDAWITAGAGRPMADSAFETSGRPWLFSNFQGEVTLHVTYVREPVLVLLASGIVLALGLVLIKASVKRRLVALIALVTALCLVGVFMPATVFSLLDAAKLGAILVLMSWAAQAVLVRRRHAVAAQADAAFESTDPDASPED